MAFAGGYSCSGEPTQIGISVQTLSGTDAGSWGLNTATHHGVIVGWVKPTMP